MSSAPYDPCDNFNFMTSRISRLINHIIEIKRPLEKVGYPSSCLEVLGELWRQDGINQKDLGKALVKNKSSINKMVIALEKAELIYRKEDKQDRRNNIVLLTQKGRDFKKFLTQRANEGEKRATQGISREDVLKTKEVLKKMYGNLQVMYDVNLSEKPNINHNN